MRARRQNTAATTRVMTEPPVTEDKVYTFVLDQIETVPHLEALLLLWNSRPQPWTVENLSKRLYVSTEIVDALLDDLVRRRPDRVRPGHARRISLRILIDRTRSTSLDP